MKKLKQENGSITLFVLIAMLFFVLFLTGMYMLSTAGEQTGISETAKIKEIYEKDVNNVNDVYETMQDTLKQNLKDVVEIGDYVAYDPTKGVTDTSLLSYTSEVGTGLSHGNGHSKQTFSANSNIRWRVFAKEEETGEVILISDTSIKADSGVGLGIYGAIGYLYGEKELNEICKIYGYGKGANTSKTFSYQVGDVIEGLTTETMTGSGARSINVDDINKITKYDVTTYTLNNSGITYKYGETQLRKMFYPTRTTESGVSNSANIRSDVFTAYRYNASNYITDVTSPIYEMLFGNNISYWLASRGVNARSDVVDFDMFCVYKGNVVEYYICCGDINAFFNSSSNDILDVRPIVYLKSNIQTNGKDENGVWMIIE